MRRSFSHRPCLSKKTPAIFPQLAFGFEAWQQGRIEVMWIFHHLNHCIFPAAPVRFHAPGFGTYL